MPRGAGLAAGAGEATAGAQAPPGHREAASVTLRHAPTAFSVNARALGLPPLRDCEGTYVRTS